MLFTYWKKIITGIKWIVQLLKMYLRTISSFRVYLLNHFDIWKSFHVQLKKSLSSCYKNKCIIMHIILIILTFISEWYDYYNNQEQDRIYSCYNAPCFPRTIIHRCNFILTFCHVSCIKIVKSKSIIIKQKHLKNYIFVFLKK